MVRRGVSLILSTIAILLGEQLSGRFVDARPLLGAYVLTVGTVSFFADVTLIIAYIDAIDPDSWVDIGGEVGMMMTFDRLLIIRHTPAVQARTDVQLKQWRAEAAAAANK